MCIAYTEFPEKSCETGILYNMLNKYGVSLVGGTGVEKISVTFRLGDGLHVPTNE